MVFTPPSFPPFAGDRNPLAKGSSTFLTKPLFNSLYDPFGSPSRGQKPQEREDVTALRCSEPLRYKVGGASKPSPGCAGWDRLGTTPIKNSPGYTGWGRLGTNPNSSSLRHIRQSRHNIRAVSKKQSPYLLLTV